MKSPWTKQIIPSANTLLRHPYFFHFLVQKKLRTMQRCRWVRSHKDNGLVSPKPFAFTIKLTMACNLRCKMCMQWGETGFHKELKKEKQKEELDFALLKKLIDQTNRDRPFYLLWGGEPFMYSHMAELLDYLKEKKTFASICTNGTHISRFHDQILDNPYLCLVISLDGFEAQNDPIRGRGVYRKVIEEIRGLQSSKGKTPYLGFEFTIMPENVGIMYEFCRQAAELKCDWIVFNLTWAISPKQADDFKDFTKRHFNITPVSHLGYRFDYPLDPEIFIEQYRKIESEHWPMQVSWQPPMKEPEQIYTFLNEPEKPLTNNFCYKQWIRADIMPNGDVVTCKEFPDIPVGNLKDNDIYDLFNAPQYLRFRSILQDGLTPVCSKCDALGWYDDKR